MIGVIITSHGKMAEGVLDACELFFPDGLSQIKALGLKQEDAVEQFEEKILNAIFEVNSGDGVIVFSDLVGGTPANCSRRIALALNDDNIQYIAGYNLAIVLELLGLRFAINNISELDLDTLLSIGSNGVASLNQQIKQNQEGIGGEIDFFDFY